MKTILHPGPLTITPRWCSCFSHPGFSLCLQQESAVPPRALLSGFGFPLPEKVCPAPCELIQRCTIDDLLDWRGTGLWKPGCAVVAGRRGGRKKKRQMKMRMSLMTTRDSSLLMIAWKVTHVSNTLQSFLPQTRHEHLDCYSHRAALGHDDIAAAALPMLSVSDIRLRGGGTMKHCQGHFQWLYQSIKPSATSEPSVGGRGDEYRYG